jgi:hypothetical protein
MLQNVTAPCPRCANPITLKVSNQQTLVNGPYVSMVLLQHPRHSACASCGLVCAPSIAGIGQLQIVPAPVPEREEEQRIIAAG